MLLLVSAVYLVPALLVAQQVSVDDPLTNSSRETPKFTYFVGLRFARADWNSEDFQHAKMIGSDAVEIAYNQSLVNTSVTNNRSSFPSFFATAIGADRRWGTEVLYESFTIHPRYNSTGYELAPPMTIPSVDQLSQTRSEGQVNEFYLFHLSSAHYLGPIFGIRGLAVSTRDIAMVPPYAIGTGKQRANIYGLQGGLKYQWQIDQRQSLDVVCKVYAMQGSDDGGGNTYAGSGPAAILVNTRGGSKMHRFGYELNPQFNYQVGSSVQVNLGLGYMKSRVNITNYEPVIFAFTSQGLSNVVVNTFPFRIGALVDATVLKRYADDTLYRVQMGVTVGM